MKRNPYRTVFLLFILVIVVLSLAVGLGSVPIPFEEQVRILADAIFGIKGEYAQSSGTILLTIRIPRAFVAFLVGGGLAVAGVVTQSILQNPLASSYTLGVSSGAALGAAIMTVCEVSIPFLGALLLPAGGFIGGLLSVLFVMALAKKIDHCVSSHTVVLIGMIVSMFANAIIMLLSFLFVKH